MTADPRPAAVGPQPAPLARRSPLGATTEEPFSVASAEGLLIQELPFQAQVLVRGALSVQDLGRMDAETGIALSPTPNQFDPVSPGTVAFALAQDEWLIVRDGQPAALEGRLREVVAPLGGTVVDVSAQRTVLSISGPRAVDILASGCSIDLDLRAFPVGAAAQTMLARVDVILARVGVDAVRVLVRGSFARYLADWLIDAIDGLD